MTDVRKTIAIDIRLLGKKRTGDETVFFHLTREVLKLDKTNRYCLVTDESSAIKIASLYVRLECIGQENVAIVSLPSANRFVWNAWTLPKYLFQNKIDVFHTQYILPLFSPERTRIVVHIHDVSFRAHPELIGWLDRFFLTMLIPRSLRRAGLIIAPSQFTKDEIVKYYAVRPEKIAVISNAVGGNFRSAEKNTEGDRITRAKFHIPQDFIIAVGTFQPRKNIPLLIRAFASLRKRLPEMHLVLVGDRGAHHADRRIAETVEEENLGNAVIFPGFIPEKDLPSVMRLARVFAFPSCYEGFGIPLLEAMSQHVPVAASDIPSLREVGDNAALYFDPLSIANCEETLYTLCTNEEQRTAIIKHGDERVAWFSWRKSARALIDEYNKLS